MKQMIKRKDGSVSQHGLWDLNKIIINVIKYK